MANENDQSENALRELSAQYSTGLPHEVGDDVDTSLIAASLAMTPWERMRANDDALNFAESLRAAMIRRHAKPF